MELKPGYKETDAGVMPDGWQAEALGPFVQIASGESPSGFRFESGGVPYFKVEQLNLGEKYLSSSDYYVRSEKTVPAGSIIFPKRGASILLNKVRILTSDSFMDTNLMTLTPSSSIESEYLYYALTQVGLWRVADTTSIPQINNKHIRPLVIPLPPLPEQRAIAAALSDVDALIGSLDRLIAKKRDLKQAAMQQLLTGQTRLAAFSARSSLPRTSEKKALPGDWRTSALEEVASTASGTTPARSLADRYYRDGSIHWVKTLDLNNGEVRHTDELVTELAIEETSLRVFPKGTVLVAMYGGFNQIGRTGITRMPAAVNQAITAIQVKAGVLHPEYLLALLNFRVEYWRSVASSSRKDPNITSLDVKRFCLTYPELDEQIAIASALTDMDAELSALEQRRDKTRLLKQGMMQELLTGRTRLV